MLGENITALRKKQGMSQQTLAESLFVTRQTISKWEKNISVPDADALLRLADALDTTVQALLGQEEAEAAPQPSDIAAALMRINDQLAIQNRRRARVWKIVAWVIGILLALQQLLLVLGYTAYSTDSSISVATEMEEPLEIIQMESVVVEE